MVGTPNTSRVVHDFSRNPLLVYWEMTQSCGLACKHCRAEAMAEAHPLELTTRESKNFLDQLPGFGEPLPHVILTGGDPLGRPIFIHSLTTRALSDWKFRLLRVPRLSLRMKPSAS